MARFLDINGNPKPTVLHCSKCDNVPDNRICVQYVDGSFLADYYFPYEYGWKIYVRFKPHDVRDTGKAYEISVRSKWYEMKSEGDYMTAKITKLQKSGYPDRFYFLLFASDEEVGGNFTGDFDIDFVFEPVK